MNPTITDLRAFPLGGVAAGRRADPAVAPAQPSPRTVRVAVVIPFFQRQPGILARALRSIACQRLDGGIAVEVIVVNDGSPCPPGPDVDSGGEGLAVRVLTQANGGPGAARNAGLDSVPQQVDFIAFLDSDDEWRPDHLVRAVTTLRNERDLYFCDNQPFEFPHSYFCEIRRQTSGFIDVATLRGVDRTVGSDAAGRFETLSFPSATALDHMTRLYLAHTSTIVLRRETVGYIRFDSSLRVAGEDYLYILSVASRSRRVCFTLDIQVDRGRGVNLYMGSVEWGSPGNLRLILDNLCCFTKAKRLGLGTGADDGIAYRICCYRTEFLYAWLRSAIFGRKIDMQILWRAFKIDTGLIVSAPHLMAAALYRKLSGARAVDHFNVAQSSTARDMSA